MPKANVFNMAGEKIGEIELSEAIFGIEPNKSVLHDSVKNHLANCRQGTQSALTKGEVSYTTKKPWRQKGTGRARAGYAGSPVWHHVRPQHRRRGHHHRHHPLSLHDSHQRRYGSRQGCPRQDRGGVRLMKTAYDVIIRPIITEQSMEDLDIKKYAFEVAKNANKIEIKKAIEEIFGVTVIKVTTLNVRSKAKRTGAYPMGKTASWKKAVVKLSADSKNIELFEGMA